ncbi:MAG: hypothetical protein INR71_14625 [Terriglobus roseus]|nr:hypothetical protein [Terriglobus roseus]
MDEALLPSDPKARKAVMGGILLIALGLGTTWLFAIRPLMELARVHHTSYYLKGVLMGPLLLYLGILVMTGKFVDGQIRRLNDNGKPALTRKGWIVVGGAVSVMALTLAAWYGYLHSMGYQETNGL